MVIGLGETVWHGDIFDEPTWCMWPDIVAFKVALTYICSCHSYTLTVPDLSRSKYGRPKEKEGEGDAQGSTNVTTGPKEKEGEADSSTKSEGSTKVEVTTASSRSKPDLSIYYDVEIDGAVHRMYDSACSFIAVQLGSVFYTTGGILGTGCCKIVPKIPELFYLLLTISRSLVGLRLQCARH